MTARNREQRRRARERADGRPRQVLVQADKPWVPEPLPATGGFPVLVFGDTAGTGFGTVTRDLCLAMIREGADPRLMSMNEDMHQHADPGWPEALKGRTIALGLPDGWMSQALQEVGPVAVRETMRALGVFSGTTVPGWRPAAALFISDHGSLEVSPWLGVMPPDVPAFIYEPIEGIGLAPSWKELWERVKPIAMCNAGADEIAKVLGERPPVVYHGIDPKSFWQVSPERPLMVRTGPNQTLALKTKNDCRRLLGWDPSWTVMFRADRLMPRKQFPAMFRSLAPVLARHPEARLILHCRTRDQGGILHHEVSKYPQGIRDRIVSTGMHDQYGGAPREILMAMYNAADVLVSTCAEGFGLTIAESLACGTPAVALNFSSLPEVVGPAGILVDEWALIDNVYSYFWAMPKGDGYTEAMERMVSDRELRESLGRLGPSHVAQFDWDTAAKQMLAILQGQDPAIIPTEATAGRRLAALGLVGGRA